MASAQFLQRRYPSGHIVFPLPNAFPPSSSLSFPLLFSSVPYPLSFLFLHVSPFLSLSVLHSSILPHPSLAIHFSNISSLCHPLTSPSHIFPFPFLSLPISFQFLSSFPYLSILLCHHFYIFTLLSLSVNYLFPFPFTFSCLYPIIHSLCHFISFSFPSLLFLFDSFRPNLYTSFI